MSRVRDWYLSPSPFASTRTSKNNVKAAGNNYPKNISLKTTTL